MPQYRVTFLVDASVSILVDAENEEQAKEKAWEEASSPTLCHQCSDELEVGDITELHSVEEN